MFNYRHISPTAHCLGSTICPIFFILLFVWLYKYKIWRDLKIQTHTHTHTHTHTNTHTHTFASTYHNDIQIASGYTCCNTCILLPQDKLQYGISIQHSARCHFIPLQHNLLALFLHFTEVSRFCSAAYRRSVSHDLIRILLLSFPSFFFLSSRHVSNPQFHALQYYTLETSTFL